MRAWSTGIVIAILALCAANAAAQAGKFGIGIHGSSVASATEEDKREMQWGLHARARLSHFFALEGSLDFRSEEIDEATIKLYPIQVSGLFYLLPASKLGLYGLLGIGWTRVSASGNIFGEGVENTEFGYHWGFGAEIGFGSSAVFADVRYLNLDLGISSLVVPDLDTEGWQLNFGYTFYF